MATNSNIDPQDGGWLSRKFWIGIFGLLLISGVALLIHKIPELSSIYPTLVGGVLGIVTMYSGVSSVGDFLVHKHIQAMSGIPTQPLIQSNVQVPPTQISDS